MDAVRYRELRKKENKSDIEWELLKSEMTLRTISELVTDADKHDKDKDPRYFIDRIRECLKDNR